MMHIPILDMKQNIKKLKPKCKLALSIPLIVAVIHNVWQMNSMSTKSGDVLACSRRIYSMFSSCACWCLTWNTLMFSSNAATDYQKLSNITLRLAINNASKKNKTTV